MLVATVVCLILCLVLFFVSLCIDNEAGLLGSLICFLLTIIFFAIGCFNGFVNYPKTEGVHQGVITAVDLEGVYFRRYNVFLKSSGYTTQSDETIYQIYDYETELAEQLKKYIGKKVKLHYGHDGIVAEHIILSR